MNEKLRHHFGEGPVAWVPAWGISKLRKRAGRFAGVIPGDARWFDEWYARVMSPDMAKKLADLGVNLVILPFSLGGSAEAESEERADFERMTAHLHEAGIASLPYLQYQNILHEGHHLDESTWAVGLDGERTGFAYWRRTVCQGTDGFIRHMKGLIDDAIRRGADGIWIDNTYLKPCGCTSCMTRFRAHLAEQHSHLLQELRLPDFQHIDLPPVKMDRLTAYASDPIVQAYIGFLCEHNLSILQELKTHLEAQSPMGLFASNPGLYRGLAYGVRGMDLYRLIRLHDLMYLENRLYPHVSGAHAEGNYHGFICCNTLGAVGIPGAWKPHLDFESTQAQASTGLPENGDEVETMLYEAAAFNGSPGLFWAIRARSHQDAANPDELKQTQIDRPELFTAAQGALRFLRTIPGGTRRNVAEIGILYHRASHDLNHANTAASIHAAERLLHEARLPYDLVFSEDWNGLSRFSVIVCPDVKLLSDEDAQSLRAYVAGGGHLMIIGPLGTHDERNRIREEAVLADMTGVSAFGAETWTTREWERGRVTTLMRPGLTQDPIPNLFPASTLTWPQWMEESKSAIEAIDRLLPKGRTLRVEGAGAIGVSFSRLENGEHLAQFIRYDTAPDAQALTVAIREDLCSDRPGLWYCPGAKPVNAPPITTNGYRTYTLRDFRRFGALALT